MCVWEVENVCVHVGVNVWVGGEIRVGDVVYPKNSASLII